MAKLKFIVAAVVIIGLASVITWQHSRNDSLREDNDGLKQALAELKILSDDSAPTAAADALTEEQKTELLKLRAEVTELQTQTNQIAVLTDANLKLMASLKKAQSPLQPNASKKKGPEDALPQDIHPKDSWGYRGYGSPEATVESTCWALLNGDMGAALRAFSPDMLPEMTKEMEGKNFADEMRKINMSEFRVLDRQQISPDEMALTIYTARQDENGNKVENSQEKTVFQRINGEWKVTKKAPPDD